MDKKALHDLLNNITEILDVCVTQCAKVSERSKGIDRQVQTLMQEGKCPVCETTYSYITGYATSPTGLRAQYLARQHVVQHVREKLHGGIPNG